MTISNLNNQLNQAKQAFIASTPAEVHEEMFRSIRELQQLGLASGQPVGTKVKDFKLKNALGQNISLYEELAKGPVVLTFYRGAWCPYCNLQLRAYEQMLPEIHALGGQLLAVSAQTPDHSLSQVEKEQLSFQVLSDTNGLLAARYNLLYDVPDTLREIYLSFGIDLAEYHATERWILPVPATFMIDESAVIRSAYVNPDFMQRWEPEDILHELRKL
ncbi:peroxiredoxin-like family protein [Paenibacillus filicis]|uniref:thioredoxin-dependent peroxiredoxin n=1 Tax=Paenibacillus filicis TaxID=669464 RepID=A0ABU9DME9_9BACL